MKHRENLGEVNLMGIYGTDLTPVNVARASFNKHTTVLRKSDIRLLSFLMREGHWSPFRHCFMAFSIEAPLMVARQWWKYVVGSYHGEPIADHLKHEEESWNEMSRRYVTETPEFYIPLPADWRETPENMKQGSGGVVAPDVANRATTVLSDHIRQSVRLYEQAMKAGICAEQARLFLPAYAMKTKWYWTASIQSIAHFLDQRLAHEAQSEIRWFAERVQDHFQDAFPSIFNAWQETKVPLP